MANFAWWTCRYYISLTRGIIAFIKNTIRSDAFSTSITIMFYTHRPNRPVHYYYCNTSLVRQIVIMFPNMYAQTRTPTAFTGGAQTLTCILFADWSLSFIHSKRVHEVFGGIHAFS